MPDNLIVKTNGLHPGYHTGIITREYDIAVLRGDFLPQARSLFYDLTTKYALLKGELDRTNNPNGESCEDLERMCNLVDSFNSLLIDRVGEHDARNPWMRERFGLMLSPRVQLDGDEICYHVGVSFNFKHMGLPTPGASSNDMTMFLPYVNQDTPILFAGNDIQTVYGSGKVCKASDKSKRTHLGTENDKVDYFISLFKELLAETQDS